MNQGELLRHVTETLDRLALPDVLVGSFAGYAYGGETRFTQDIDFVIDLVSGQVSALCSPFPPPEFFVSEQAVRDAVRSRFQFNILHPASGNKWIASSRKAWIVRT